MDAKPIVDVLAKPVEKPASAEGFSDILDSVARNEAPLTRLIQSIGSESHRARLAEVAVSKHISWMMVGFVTVVLLGLGGLVALGKMSGDALTFVVGVVIGYLMQFVQGRFAEE